VYAPDHALHADTDPEDIAYFEAFVRDADLLIHDGQYTEAEQKTAIAYGHSTIEAVIALADRANVGAVLLTHHAPNRTDDQLDELTTRCATTPAGRPVEFARQDCSYAVQRSEP
jgi:ribonuclease BN (tRNA processing enzyme)